jgi:hypothetical protein
MVCRHYSTFNFSAMILYKETALTLVTLLHKQEQHDKIFSLFNKFKSTLQERAPNECTTALCSYYFTVLSRYILCSIVLIFSYQHQKKFLTQELFNNVLDWTQENLSSHLSTLRLETIHILQSLENSVPYRESLHQVSE